MKKKHGEGYHQVEKITNISLTGIYLYGRVGSGKSMLMDMFFEPVQVTDGRKIRFYFEPFMVKAHRTLHNWRINGADDTFIEMREQHRHEMLHALARCIVEKAVLVHFPPFPHFFAFPFAISRCSSVLPSTTFLSESR